MHVDSSGLSARADENGRYRIGMGSADQDDDELSFPPSLAQPYDRHAVFGATMHLSQARVAPVELRGALDVTRQDRHVSEGRMHDYTLVERSAHGEWSLAPSARTAQDGLPSS